MASTKKQSKKTETKQHCLCGCGQNVASGSSFRQGHDAKLHSKYNAIRDGEAPASSISKEALRFASKRWGGSPRKHGEGK